MADLNNCSFTGRLTKDAEKKVVGSNGTDLVVFDIANNTGWGDYKKTLYLTCNVWGKKGVSIHPYLLKGKTVAITGSLEVQQWTGQDGEERRKNVINCTDVLLMADGKKDDNTPTKEYAPPKDGGDEYEEVTF